MPESAILKTLIDISRIITTSHNLEETLEQTVALLSESLDVDACSIYIYDQESQELELKATVGLSREAVGNVKMPVSEGLVGYVFETKHHVNVMDVSIHPRFKYFPSIDEERLSSFLGVPLVEYRKTLGVLTIQNQENRLFTEEEERLLITIASQISGLVSKALLVDLMQYEAERVRLEERPSDSFQLEGVPIAGGLAMDKVVVLTRERMSEPEYYTERAPQEELRSLMEAIEESEHEILELIQEISTRVSERDAAIFHSHLLFLEDRNFINKITEKISKGGSAAYAVSHVVKDYLQAFRALEDPYLAERASDLEDVGLRLLTHLGLERKGFDVSNLNGILVAEMLSPSDTAKLDPLRIKGILTEVGGHVSHAAILARSLRIPAVSGIPNVVSLLKEGEEVLLDGSEGKVVVNPDDSISREYARYQETRLDYLSHLDELLDVDCASKCGERIYLRANVGLTQDLEDCVLYGAENIGLYRTEVFYLMSQAKPAIDDLVEIYERAQKVLPDKPVVFRTLDLGGGRTPTYLNFPKEENPYMGLRSIRYQLSHIELLHDQIMAMLRVAENGEVRMAVPMVSQLSELTEVRRVYNLCREEYQRMYDKEAPSLQIGMIFEVPSTLLNCGMFLEASDFAIIGSNDLTQYVMAVDRNNPYVSHYFDPLEPSVLSLVKHLVTRARLMGKTVDFTGELASDPEGCLVLVGLGLRNFSLNSPLIPIMKDRMGQYTIAEMEKLADTALSSTSADMVRRNIQQFLNR